MLNICLTTFKVKIRQLLCSELTLIVAILEKIPGTLPRSIGDPARSLPAPLLWLFRLVLWLFCCSWPWLRSPSPFPKRSWKPKCSRRSVARKQLLSSQKKGTQGSRRLNKPAFSGRRRRKRRSSSSSSCFARSLLQTAREFPAFGTCRNPEAPSAVCPTDGLKPACAGQKQKAYQKCLQEDPASPY